MEYYLLDVPNFEPYFQYQVHSNISILVYIFPDLVKLYLYVHHVC